MVTLSIIIPAYDERRKIGGDIEAASRFLVAHQIDGEIIVADDGSTDGTPDVAAGTTLPSAVTLIVVRNPTHQGKGAAVRSGILASSGSFVMFADSGLTIPFANALDGLRLLERGSCEIAHGSRRLPGSVVHKKQDWDRKLISRAFHWTAKTYLRIPPHLTDTQCGFKIYRGEIARDLYAQCRTNGFLFDIEIILLAGARRYRIVEFPVEWTCDRDSRITVARNAGEVLRDVMRIRRSHRCEPATPQT